MTPSWSRIRAWLEPNQELPEPVRLPAVALSVLSFGSAVFSLIATTATQTLLSTERTVPILSLNIGLAVLFTGAGLLARRGRINSAFWLLILSASGYLASLPFASDNAPVMVLSFMGFVMAFLGFKPDTSRLGITLAVGLGLLGAFLIVASELPDGAPQQIVFLAINGIVGLVVAFLITLIRARLSSERERLRQQVLSADRMASLGIIAAGIGHEINNPLAYVQLNLEVLRDGSDLPEEERAACLAEAQEGAERIRNVVRNLRFFSSPDETPRAVDVEQVIESTVRLVFPQIRHQGDIGVDVTPGLAVTDAAGRLGQVLLNLVTNAVQAVVAAKRTPAEVRVSARLSGTTVEVLVEDNGPGVAPADRARIFEPFFTTRRSDAGTGLGLSICRRLVQEAGGTLEVGESSLGGAAFTLRLPSAAKEEDDDDASVPLQKTPRRSVLIIEDEPYVGSSLVRALRPWRVEIAPDGRHALDLLQTESFDLILCDVMMPGLNGLEVYEQASLLRPDLQNRFVFITGGTFSEVTEADLAQSGRPLLHKPLQLSQVRGLVDQVNAKA